MPARPVSQCALPICIIPPPPAPPIPLPTHSLCKELAAYIHVAFPDRRKRTCVPLARSLRRTRRAKGLADTRDSDAWSDGLWHSLGTSQRGTLLSLLQDRACCSTRDLILGRTHALEISSFFSPDFISQKQKQGTVHNLRNGFSGQSAGSFRRPKRTLGTRPLSHTTLSAH